MLNSINEYTLDSNIDDYPEGSLIEFSKESYLIFEKFFDIKRQFRGEVFYHPRNNIFLEMETSSSVVASINNIILKIYYHFDFHDIDRCQMFRDKIVDHIRLYAKLENLHAPIIRKVAPGFNILTWGCDWGNIVLEAGPKHNTSYIITSHRIRYAKQRGLISTLLRSH